MFSMLFKKKLKKVNLELEREYVPFFTGPLRLKNRDFKEVLLGTGFKEDLEKQGPEFVEISEGFMDSQSKGFGVHYADESFEIEGVKQGDFIKKTNGGYMENITSYYKVVMVTNKHVFLVEEEKKYMTTYSHLELEELRKEGNLQHQREMSA